MSASKPILRNCLRNQRDMIMDTTIVERDFEFEENGFYVFVWVRYAGKSYLLYQRIKQLLAYENDWSNLLYVNFDDERLTEFSTEDFNTLLDVHYEDYGKKPIVFLDEVQRIENGKCLPVVSPMRNTLFISPEAMRKCWAMTWLLPWEEVFSS